MSYFVLDKNKHRVKDSVLFFSNSTLISQTPPAPLAFYSHWQEGGPAHLRKQALPLIVTYGQRCWLQYLHMDTEHACVLSHFSHVQRFATPWTVARHPPLAMGFSRQEYWNGCHFLFQEIFRIQGSHSCLLSFLLCRQMF